MPLLAIVAAAAAWFGVRVVKRHRNKRHTPANPNKVVKGKRHWWFPGSMDW